MYSWLRKGAALFPPKGGPRIRFLAMGRRQSVSAQYPSSPRRERRPFPPPGTGRYPGHSCFAAVPQGAARWFEIHRPDTPIRGGVSGVKRIGGDHCRTVLFFRRRCEFPPLPPARRCLSQRNLSVFFSVPVGERADPTYTIPSTNPFRGGWSAAMDKAGKRSLVYGKRRKPQPRVKGRKTGATGRAWGGIPGQIVGIDG